MKDRFEYFDEEEKELIESFERGEWRRVDNFEEEKEKAVAAAKATFAQEQISILVSKQDINRLKIRSMEEGIPYQILASGIIHKYLDGRLSESL